MNTHLITPTNKKIVYLLKNNNFPKLNFKVLLMSMYQN